MDIEPDIRLNEWVGFSVLLMLIFGVGFQLPLLMLMLDRVGLVTYDWVVKQRKMAIMGLAVLAALATPGGDPITMLFLAVPMYILFELGLLLMAYFRRHNPFATREGSFAEVDAEI
jgi:sec-independent protein translocase protein TatC